MSGFKREDPTTEEIANELYRRSRLSEAKLAEDLGFTGIRKPKPAWLSQLEEEAQAYYQQQLLAFARFHQFPKASELKAEDVCQYLAKTFSLTVQQPSQGCYQVTVSAFSDAVKTQRAVEAGLLLVLYRVPTTPMLQISGGKTTQYPPLLKALLYLPCRLDKESWELIQHNWAQEQKHWEQKEEKGKNKPLRSERQAMILQRQALSYLTVAKDQLLQEAWDQKLNTRKQSQYLKIHLAKRAVAALKDDLSKQKVPDLQAQGYIEYLLKIDEECQVILGQVPVEVSAPLSETKEKEQKSDPPPRRAPTKWVPRYSKNGVEIEEELNEEEDEEEESDEEKERLTAHSH